MLSSTQTSHVIASGWRVAHEYPTITETKIKKEIPKISQAKAMAAKRFRCLSR
jgi:hypothetical protein